MGVRDPEAVSTILTSDASLLFTPMLPLNGRLVVTYSIKEIVMPDKATAPAADAPVTAAKQKRDRKPSSFRQQIRASFFVHADTKLKLLAKAIGDAIVAAGIVSGDDEANPLATRVVARTRSGSKSTVQSVSIYVAPNGYEFSADHVSGVRINADLWAELRPQLEARGLSADEDGLKALVAALAATAPTPVPASES